MRQYKTWFEIVSNIIKGGREGHNADLFVGSFLGITPKELDRLRVSYLIIDLDQTMVPHGFSDIDKMYMSHLQILKNHLDDNRICFLTNQPDKVREEKILKETGIKVVSGEFRKPQADAYKAAMEFLRCGKVRSRVAMVGDRVWTDIVGAKRLGLTTIQVKVMSPEHDPILTPSMRSAERVIQTHGIKKAFSLCLAFLTLAGMGVAEFWHYASSLITSSWRLPEEIVPELYKLHLVYSIVALLFYFVVTHRNKRFSYGGKGNFVTDYFNTYPAAIRFVSSIALLIFALLANENISEVLLPIAMFYNFYVETTFIFSLHHLYHSNFGRVVRIIIDTIAVFIIASTLPSEWAPLALIVFTLPVVTSARYFNVTLSLVLSVFCVYLGYVVIGLDITLLALFVLVYVASALTITIEHEESVSPVDKSLFELLQKIPQDCDTETILSQCRKVLNCQAVYYIRDKNDMHWEGHWACKDDREDSGVMPETTVEEMHNFLITHLDDIKIDILSITQRFLNQQNRVLSAVEKIINPILKEKINSVMVIAIPANSREFIVAINNRTRNGVVRSLFSVRHARTLFLFALVLSAVGRHTDCKRVMITSGTCPAVA